MRKRERKVDSKVYREGIKRKENKQKDGASSTTADIWTQIFFWAISSLGCTLRFPWQQKNPLPCPKVKLSQLGPARSPCNGMDAFCKSDTAGEAVHSIEVKRDCLFSEHFPTVLPPPSHRQTRTLRKRESEAKHDFITCMVTGDRQVVAACSLPAVSTVGVVCLSFTHNVSVGRNDDDS